MSRKSLSHAKRLREQKRLAAGPASGGNAKSNSTAMAQPTSSAEAGPNEPVVLVLPTQSPDATTNEPNTAALASVAQLSTESTMSDEVEQARMARLPPTIENIPQEIIDKICKRIRRQPDGGRRSFLALMRVAPASRNSPLRESAAAFLFRMAPQAFPLRSFMLRFSPEPKYYMKVTILNLNLRNLNLAPQTSEDLKLFEEATAFLKNKTALSKEQNSFLTRFSKDFQCGEISARLAMLILLCPNLKHLTLPSTCGYASSDRVWIDEVLNMIVPQPESSNTLNVFRNLSSLTVHWISGARGNWYSGIWRIIRAALDIPSITKLDISSDGSEFNVMAADFESCGPHTSTITDLTLRHLHPCMQSSLILRCNALSSLHIVQRWISTAHFNDILDSVKRNKSVLEHLSIQVLIYKEGWTGFSAVLPELTKLKSLSVDDGIVRRHEGAEEVQPLDSLSFDVALFPPNLECLTLRTVKHPGKIFSIIASILNHYPNPATLNSLKVDFQLTRDDCTSWLNEKLLRKAFKISTDIYAMSAVMVRQERRQDYATATIHIKKFSELAVDLRPDPRNPGKSRYTTDMWWSEMLVGLCSNNSASATAMAELSENLKRFATVRETREEYAARRKAEDEAKTR